jgi:hypothetical protein
VISRDDREVCCRRFLNCKSVLFFSSRKFGFKRGTIGIVPQGKLYISVRSLFMSV